MEPRQLSSAGNREGVTACVNVLGLISRSGIANNRKSEALWPYSSRKAIAGSILMARRPGTTQASAAVTNNKTETAA
jgi:hypothetical protein